MDVPLPSDLETWLDKRSSELGIERETLLVQLIDTYRTSSNVTEREHSNVDERSFSNVDEGTPVDEGIGDAGTGSSDDFLRPETRVRILKSVLREKLDEEFDREIEAALDDRIEARLEAVFEQEIETRLAEELDDALEERLEGKVREVFDAELDRRLEEALPDSNVETELESLESEHREDIQDLRERLIQVKRETDRKTPIDDHETLKEQVAGLDEDLERLDRSVSELSADLDAIEEEVTTLSADLEAVEEEKVDALRASTADVEADLEEARERLQSLAWAVKQLREEVDSKDEEIDRLKRKAAELGVQTAKCEHCENSVDLSLLTDPECPHCSSAFTNVVGADGLVGSPRVLTSASTADDTE